jgi:hypothetical protein
MAIVSTYTHIAYTFAAAGSVNPRAMIAIYVY